MIIALEGGICSGKTTLAKEFERQGFYLVPEYIDIIQPCEENRIVEPFFQGSHPALLTITKKPPQGRPFVW